MTGNSFQLLRRMFEAAVAAAQPALCLPSALPPPPRSRTVVVGAGKAAAAMAQTLEQHWPRPLSGLVVTRHGYDRPCLHIETVEAAHPVPDEAGLAAAGRMMRLVQGLTADDLVIALFSGGGSALLPLPIEGVELRDKQQLSRELLRSGAAISEINCVRRHLSAIKGGRLAAACSPARVVTLLISDVPGDSPSDIASGPTVGDPTTCTDALDVLRRYRIAPSANVEAALASGAGETLKPGDPRLQRNSVHILATARTALDAAAAAARAAGVAPLILGADIEGEARAVGRRMGELARRTAQDKGERFTPCILLSGGETTVTVKGGGCGGRNAEFLLALAIALDGHPGIHALAADTDGVDGMAEIAGALIGPNTLQRAAALGLSAESSLNANDAYGFFQALGDVLITGPTCTNVNDFRAILIEA